VAKFRFVAWLLNWLLEKPAFEFQYDEGNREKSTKKHGVSNDEVEELFESRSAIPLGIQISPKVDEESLRLLVRPEGSGLSLLYLRFEKAA
jgi:uncharacterized DUF497 family protein